MIDNNAILSKCQWLSFKCNLQKAKFPLALPLSKGARFISPELLAELSELEKSGKLKKS